MFMNKCKKVYILKIVNKLYQKKAKNQNIYALTRG
jgi:hypothetical protein